MFLTLDWEFKPTDRGTHSGNYLDKLNWLKDGYNNVVNAVNAQVSAGEDSIQLKADIITINAVAIDAVTTLKDETLTYRNQAFAVSIGDITGADIDFNRVRVNGYDVALAKDLDEVDNTTDLNKPLSTVTKNALDSMQADIEIAMQIARAGVISWA